MVQGISAPTSSAGDVDVTFKGAAAFTRASSYSCTARDADNSTLASVTYLSGSSVRFGLLGHNRGDPVTFFCGGS